MPPLPVLVRAVLASTLKGNPIQIQYLSGGHAFVSSEAALLGALVTGLTSLPDLTGLATHKELGLQDLLQGSTNLTSNASHDQQAQPAHGNGLLSGTPMMGLPEGRHSASIVVEPEAAIDPNEWTEATGPTAGSVIGTSFAELFSQSPGERLGPVLGESGKERGTMGAPEVASSDHGSLESNSTKRGQALQANETGNRSEGLDNIGSMAYAFHTAVGSSDFLSLAAGLKTILALASVAFLFLLGLWHGASGREQSLQGTSKLAKLLPRLAAAMPRWPFGQSGRWGSEQQGKQGGPKGHEESSEQRQLYCAPILSPSNEEQAWPVICPPYMRAHQGACLSLRRRGTCDGDGDGGVFWSSPVEGLGIAQLGSQRRSGPPVQLLSASLRLVAGLGRVLEFREEQPSGASSGPAGPLLLVVTSGLELRLGEGAVDAQKEEGGTSKCFGILQAAVPLGGDCGRRVYTLHRFVSDEGSKGPLGPAMLAVSGGARGCELQLGAMPSGRLLAQSRQREPEQLLGSELPPAEGKCVNDLFEVSVKPGIDAVLALACTLAVAIFVPSSDVAARRI